MVQLFILFILATSSCAVNEFDYIVVGAGTAGCVVAARLSEDVSNNVLVIEAGKEPPIYSTRVPLAPLMLFTNYEWNYYYAPQENVTLEKYGAYLSRGKMLGGTSNVNAAYFIRANKFDFESWSAEGIEGWKWENVLPFYKKIEKYLIDNPNPELHSKKGPLPATIPGESDQVIKRFIKAAELNGLKYRDPNDGIQHGVCFAPLNILNGIRQTSYTNYLKPVMNERKNLIVETNSFVEKIVFDENKNAIKVMYSKNGEKMAAKIKKEIILCGGAINTPQLLMISGIGPKKHLQSLNIDVLVDLPVGQNLKDHVAVLNFHKIEGNLRDILYFGGGNAFYNTKYNPDSPFPEIQILFLSASTGLYLSFPILSRPLSKGYVQLKSSNPYEYPTINPMHLTEEIDLKILADGQRIASKIYDSMNLPNVPTFQCKHLNQTTDEYWKCIVQTRAISPCHPVGTCPMGASNAPESVVDSKLKVFGVNNVRVADASVFPEHIAGNPAATVMMIAERVCHFIKNGE